MEERPSFWHCDTWVKKIRMEFRTCILERVLDFWTMNGPSFYWIHRIRMCDLGNRDGETKHVTSPGSFQCHLTRRIANDDDTSKCQAIRRFRKPHNVRRLALSSTPRAASQSFPHIPDGKWCKSNVRIPFSLISNPFRNLTLQFPSCLALALT